MRLNTANGARRGLIVAIPGIHLLLNIPKVETFLERTY